MNCDAGCREVGHRAFRGGRGRGVGVTPALECPWNRLLGPAPITRHRLLSAGPGAGVPPTKMSRGHYLAGGGGCAGLGLDWDRYYWYNLIIQRINISSPIYDTWYSFSCSFESSSKCGTDECSAITWISRTVFVCPHFCEAV